MHKPDRTEALIDQINRAAIGNVNAETDAALICDQPIATFEAFALRHRAIDNRDAISVDLPRGNERRRTESMLRPDFAMNTVQTRASLRLLVRHLETGDTQGEAVNDIGERTQRWEMFRRNLAGVHLPDGVARVVRVVRLI